MNKNLKYGVNIDLANQTKKEMSKNLETSNERVLSKVGGFSALYNINFPEYKNPVLVLKTEEPGSKQLIAFGEDKIESVCYDMINHLINDCIVMGAKPLTVQDAIICGKMDSKKVKRIVKAISDACKEQECILTGGETSEQPGVIDDDTYILTSSIVGIVEQEKIIDGTNIQEGDIVIGVESSGLHTNGYTMVRKIMENNVEVRDMEIEGKKFIDLILDPHRCYYKAVKDLFNQEIITGMAHITGGGIKENLDRILPDNVDAEIDAKKYQILPIFNLIKKLGDVEESEMLRTFNLGVGLVIVAKPENKDKIIDHILINNINCYEIGTIVSGNKKVHINGKFIWN